MTSRLWPVLPLLFAVSQKFSSTKDEATQVPLSDMGKMLQGAVILSAQAITGLFSK